MPASLEQKAKYKEIKETVFGGNRAKWIDRRKDGSLRYSWVWCFWPRNTYIAQEHLFGRYKITTTETPTVGIKNSVVIMPDGTIV